MAIVRQYWAGFSVGDSAQKTGDIEFRIPEADYTAYATAANPAASLVTPTGLLFEAFQGLMKATIKERRVFVKDVTFPYTYPAEQADAYISDKIKVTWLAGADTYTGSIPTREPANYSTSDGISIITGATGTTEVQDFVTAFNGHVMGKNGELGVVSRMRVNDV